MKKISDRPKKTGKNPGFTALILLFLPSTYPFISVSEVCAESAITESLAPLVPAKNGSLSASITEKARVWVFLSAKCPCSDSHTEKLREAHREFSAQGFEFIGVHANQDEPLSLAEEYFRKKNLSFPIYHDRDSLLANRFQALKTPHVFVELPDHQIVYEGGIDESKKAHTTETNYLRDALREIHEGRSVTKTRTRTLGCAISRRKSS